ncbi:putative transmembrane protein [Senna tora]|uniref:Putative transmembrane protein n=1 Tax=Senna tora TaxID=362788 RepID=A0A834WXH3_9FABA|nr:putative transmembrane protein [Senna tora]
MKLSNLAFFLLFLGFIIFNNVIYVIQSEAVNSNELVVGSGSSSSPNVRRNGNNGGCEKQGVECKEGNGEWEENVVENEDYIYTNSLP